jgi:hypothetical protein
MMRRHDSDEPGVNELVLLSMVVVALVVYIFI